MSNQSLQVIDEAMARIFGGVDHRIRYLGPDATGFEEDAYNRGYKAGAEDAFALIDAGTWPDGWDGTEPVADVPLDKILQQVNSSPAAATAAAADGVANLPPNGGLPADTRSRDNQRSRDRDAR